MGHGQNRDLIFPKLFADPADHPVRDRMRGVCVNSVGGITMVSIFTGLGTGFERGSGSVLGGSGLLGSGSLGRSGEQVMVNAATGNLLISKQDEFLAGRGLDAMVSRTYNSRADNTDDNHDNWRQSTEGWLYGFVGPANANGSSIRRLTGDGSAITYSWNAERAAYVSTDGGGAFDTMTYAASDGSWTWTDGDTRVTERYEAFDTGWRLVSRSDKSGNVLSFSYIGFATDKVTTQNGEWIKYNRVGGRIDSVVTGYTGDAGIVTLTRTRYTYDARGRLETVISDLSPEDNSITDGKIYKTTYSYEGTTTYLKSIAQTDGSLLEITYDYSNRVKTYSQTTETGKKLTTVFDYDINPTAKTRSTVITDPSGQKTTLEWNIADGGLKKVTSPPAQAGGSAQSVEFGYNEADGNLTSITDSLGKKSYFSYYSGTGNVRTVEDRLGSITTRTYNAANSVVTETRTGSDEVGQSSLLTTRYVYDARNLLRFMVGANGSVTEYRYNDYGQQILQLDYTEQGYDLTGLDSGQALTEAALSGWAAAVADLNTVQGTETRYDARGNVLSTTKITQSATPANTPVISQPIANAANTSVTAQSDGLYRIVRTGDNGWIGGARSNIGLTGDFIVQLRPSQVDKRLMVGVSRDPTVGVGHQDLDYGFYLLEAQPGAGAEEADLFAWKANNGGASPQINLNVKYKAGDNLWMVRVGDAISYYKGASLDEAMANGALRTEYEATGTFFLDSTFNQSGAVVDVGFFPAAISQPVVSAANTTVTIQSDGLYRIARTGPGGNWDAGARSNVGLSGDFIVQLRPSQADKRLMVGVSRNPNTSISHGDLDYALYLTETGDLYTWKADSGDQSPQTDLKTKYYAHENLWMVRSGSTILYYKGKTINEAIANGALDTITGAVGTFYLDSTFTTADSVVDVGFFRSSASQPVISTAGTSVAMQADGLYRVTKTGLGANWDAGARSTVRLSGDFVVQLRPAQHDKRLMVGVSQSPNASLDHGDLDYAFYLIERADGVGGDLYAWKAGSGVSSQQIDLGRKYYTGDNLWMVRTGSTISYYTGATLESAMAAGHLYRFEGVAGTYYLDSTLMNSGAAVDVGVRSLVETVLPVALSNRVNTEVSRQPHGTYRIAKTGGTNWWDADAVSFSQQTGDFTLQLKPLQRETRFMVGVSASPLTSSGHSEFLSALYLTEAGEILAFKANTFQDSIGTYQAGDNLWLIRRGSTITYWQGATLETASLLYTQPNVSGAVQFDSSLYHIGATFDVTFSGTEVRRATVPVIEGNVALGGAAKGAVTNYSYDTAGRLLGRTTTGVTGEVLNETFVYDGMGRLVSSTDMNNGTTRFVFDDSQMKTIVTSANGLVRTSTYNRAGDLISVLETVLEAVLESGANITAGTETFAYDAWGRLRVTVDATGNDHYSLFDRVGRKVADINHYGDLIEYQYDAQDRVVATIRYNSRLPAAKINLVKDLSSDVQMSDIRPGADVGDLRSWRVYDNEGRLVRAIEGDGAVTAYQYDGSGRLIATTGYFSKLDSVQLASFITTPPTIQATPQAHEKDSVSRNFFDKQGNLIGILNGEGYLTRLEYDKAGQKIRETQFSKPADLQLRASGSFTGLLNNVGTAPADRSSRFVYDRLGQLRYEIDALNHVTEYVYDDGNPVASIGKVRKTIVYAGTLTAPANYGYAAVKVAVAALAAGDKRETYAVHDSAGRLAYAIDAAGAVVGYTYDTSGNLIKSIAFAQTLTTSGIATRAALDGWAASNAANLKNRVTRNFYSARNELLYTVDAEGFVTRFAYDEEGRQNGTSRWGNSLTVTDGATITDVERQLGDEVEITSASYDLDGRLQHTTDGNGVTKTRVYNANGTLAFEYAAAGTVDTSITAYVYDAAGRVATAYSGFGTADVSATSYGYDGLGNVNSVTDPNQNVTLRSYDRAGRLLSETIASASNTFEYNAFGEVEKSVDRNGNASYKYYNNRGQVVAVRDAEGYVTETTYTTHGDVESVTRRYNRAGNAVDVYPTFVANPDKDARTSFEYDKLGRVKKIVDAENNYELYDLDAFGQRYSVRNKLGGYTYNTFDRRGFLETETLPIASVDPTGTTRATSVTNRFVYDARGNRFKTIEAEGLPEQRTTTYRYDAANRLEAVERGVLNETGTAVITAIDRTYYDARGNIIEMEDAVNNRTLFYYDDLNRLVVQIDASGAYTSYTYTLEAGTGGRQVVRSFDQRVSLPTAAGGTPPAVPMGGYRETVTLFDKLGRVDSVSIANVRTGAWNGSVYAIQTGALTTDYEYDANGNVVRVADPNGNNIFSFYDKLGRKTAQVDQQNYLTTWSYYADGNVDTERRAATAVSWTPNIVSPPSIGATAYDRISKFTYNRNGNRLTEERVGVTYSTINGNNGEMSQGAASSLITYEYNGLGQITSKLEATGDKTVYWYDQGGRLNSEERAAYINNDGVSDKPILYYKYDGLGNLTRTRQGGTVSVPSDIIIRYHYSYGRLVSVSDPVGGERRYFYDAAGRKIGEQYNRERFDGSYSSEGISYGYDSSGHVVRQAYNTVANGVFTDAANTDVTTMTYNAHGELETRALNGVVQEYYSYDNAGRLWRSNAGDGVWRYFISDRNGNQSLMIESEGDNIAHRTLDEVLAIARPGNAEVGTVYVNGINATITEYDGRSQATATMQMRRQLTAGSVTTDLVSRRSYNGFGEVASETDARNNTTYYNYNTMGRLTSIQRAAVNVTSSNGTVTSQTPIEKFFYDRSGRLVGQEDANNYRTTKLLLAGTGYGGAGDAAIVKEWHPDGGTLRFAYDVYGNLRKSWDETERLTQMSYDALGRVTQIIRPGALLTETFAYDVLGNRIRHWTSYYGENEQEITGYDAQGRVTATRAFGGDATTITYGWSMTANTWGTGIVGAHTATTTYLNNNVVVKTSIARTDSFGNVQFSQDLGGNQATYTYDLAGRLTQRSTPFENRDYVWLNTGLLAAVTDTATVDGETTTTVAWSSYDEAGNKVAEMQTRNNVTIQNATASYDGLNRLVQWRELGGSATPAARMWYEYDAASNIRRTKAEFTLIDKFGAALSPQSSYDNWYLYDQMNRMTLAQGQLVASVNGQIVTGDAARGGAIERGGGYAITYDGAGRRTTVTTRSNSLVWRGLRATFQGMTYYSDEDPNWQGYHFTANGRQTYSGNVLETYTYTAEGLLDTVSVSSEQAEAHGSLQVLPNGQMGGSILRANYDYDALGRLTSQVEYSETGAIAYSRGSFSYDRAGKILSETNTTRQEANGASPATLTTYIVNDYGTGADYALGAVRSVDADVWKDGVDANAPDTLTINSYRWFDGAVASTITYNADTSQGVVYTTTNKITPTGQVISAAISAGTRSRNVAMVYDAYGQVVDRREDNPTAGVGDPRQIWYRFNGRQLGYVDNDTNLETDYVGSIANRQALQGSGPFRNGSEFSGVTARFGEAYVAINSYAQGSSSGSYTAQGGETLSSVASQLWGDADLWYKLAQANGLGGDTPLIGGQVIAVPQGVVRNTNSATTFKPYDPADAIGNLTPLGPKPVAKKANNCGGFGQILIAVVAIAVTVATTNTFVGAFASNILGGAAAGVAGSVAGQVVGLATGIQDRFDWKGVALSGIAGGVGGALKGVAALNGGSGIGKVATDVARGMIGSAATQGIALAAGLQSKFDFAGMAVAGAMSGVGGKVDQKLAGRSGFFGTNAGKAFVGATASGIAGATLRSVIEGTSFGDNVLAVLPDVIGQTIGNLVADRIIEKRGSVGGISTVVDPETGKTIVVDAALAREIELRRDGRRFDDEVDAGIRNRDGTLRGTVTVEGPDGTIVVTGDALNPERRLTYSRAQNEYWRQGFETLDVRHSTDTGLSYTDAADLRQAYAARDAYLAKLDAYATQLVDRPIGFGLAGITGGALLAPLVPWAVSLTGATGGTAMGLTVFGEGVVGAASNVPIRYGFGQSNTVATFADDGLTAMAFGVVGRGVTALGGRLMSRIGAPAAAERAGVTFEGALYRAVPEGGNPLDISYSVAANHRYTAPGQGGLYFASNARTVEAEFVNNGSSLTGRTLHSFPESSVRNLLDLSNPATRADLGVSLGDLTRTGGTSAWRYEVTQPLGAFAQRNGYSGIIAPSAQADGGVNLILFGSKGVR